MTKKSAHLLTALGSPNSRRDICSEETPNKPAISSLYQHFIGITLQYPEVIRPLLASVNRADIPDRSDFPSGSAEGCIVGAMPEAIQRTNEHVRVEDVVAILEQWAAENNDSALVADKALRMLPHLFSCCPLKVNRELVNVEHALRTARAYAQKICEEICEPPRPPELSRSSEVARPSQPTLSMLPRDTKCKKQASPKSVSKGNGLVQRLADALLDDDHIAKDSGGKAYVFENGVYKGSGDEFIKRRVKRLLQSWDIPKMWSSHRANEVVKYILVDAPRVWEKPPLNVVNVRNGVLDVLTRQLRPHTRVPFDGATPRHLRA